MSTPGYNNEMAAACMSCLARHAHINVKLYAHACTHARTHAHTHVYQSVDYITLSDFQSGATNVLNGKFIPILYI